MNETYDIYVAFSQKDGHLFGGVSGWCITKKCLVLMYSMMTWQYIPLENIFYFQESTRDATAKVCEKDITTQGEK